MNLILSLVQKNNICVIWREITDLPDNTFSYWYSLLNTEEQEKTQRLRCSTAKNNYIAAHALLRQGLTAIQPEIHPSTWLFTTQKNGKPSLLETQNPLSIEFNLSHTNGMVAIAFSITNIVGVDVESLSRQIKPIWETVFSPNEIAYLKNLSSIEQIKSAITLWTTKEALVKASGQGLTVQIKDIVCYPHTTLISTGTLPGQIDEWKIWNHSPNQQHIISVAIYDFHRRNQNCQFIKDPF